MRLDCNNFLDFLRSLDTNYEYEKDADAAGAAEESGGAMLTNRHHQSPFLPSLRKVGIKIHGSFDYQAALEALANNGRGSRLIVGSFIGKAKQQQQQQQQQKRQLMKSVQVMTNHIRSSVQGGAGGRAAIHAAIWSRRRNNNRLPSTAAQQQQEGVVGEDEMTIQRQSALLIEAFGPGRDSDVTHGVIDLLSDRSGRTLPVLSVLEGLETLIKDYPTSVLAGINARANEVAEVGRYICH